MALFGKQAYGAHGAHSTRGARGAHNKAGSHSVSEKRKTTPLTSDTSASAAKEAKVRERRVSRHVNTRTKPSATPRSRLATRARQHDKKTSSLRDANPVSQKTVSQKIPPLNSGDTLPAEDFGTATDATGSYADLAPTDELQQKPLGPVIISLREVTKIYPAQPDKPALNKITLDIHVGEFLFLVGHSGSGKSTFIRMLNREIIPTSGELVVAGENLRTIRSWRIPYLRRKVGCVFQDFKLLPNKTAFENVAFALEVIGKSRHVVRTQVPEVLRLVGLEEKMNKLPDQLSGGEQQRVSIARSIVNRPPILICDEPTGNLDPQTSLGIMRLLERINRTNTTVLVATHDREMVDQMRRRVLALEAGVLVRDQKKGVYGYGV